MKTRSDTKLDMVEALFYASIIVVLSVVGAISSVRQIDMRELIQECLRECHRDEGRDFYSAFASKWFHTPYEEVTKEQRAFVKHEVLLGYMYGRVD